MGRAEIPSRLEDVTFATGVRGNRVGRLAVVRVWPYAVKAANTWEEVCTLPEGWRPYLTSTYASQSGCIEISSAGLVRARKDGGTGNVYATCAFVIGS